jgi:RHS repeat-associated protein
LALKVTGSDTTEYLYDELGNLLSVTMPSDTIISYVVDGSGRRVGRKVEGALVQGFLYSGPLRIVAELDSAGAVASRFYYGNRINVPEYMDRGGSTYRIITDHLGSVRLVVDTANGAVVQRMDYDAFGTVMLDTNPGFQPFGFAGGLWDVATGLVRFGARDYDPAVGRWTAEDPMGFAGRAWKIYAYVGHNPVNLSDPAGLFCPSKECNLAIGVALANSALDGLALGWVRQASVLAMRPDWRARWRPRSTADSDRICSRLSARGSSPQVSTRLPTFRPF